MKKVMYMHMGSANHGCEALVRTTAQLLGGPEDVILWSMAKNEDVYYGSVKEVEQVLESEEIKRGTIVYFEALIKRRILHQKDANMQIFLRETFKNNMAVSIGGDNYCYPWSARQAIELNKEIRKNCKFNVLWGCSIDEDAVTPEVKDDLAGYDLITAREQMTYEMLKKINPNTVLVADSAFLLENEEISLPEGFIPRNTVGINVSPLIMKYGTENSLIMSNYEKMIEYIIKKTEMNVCLIPHVVWKNNDDRVPCRYLYEKYAYTGRILMVEDGNCKQLKYIISQCRFLVGARTHVTIAAYSTCVPTLAVGYSVKSRGIAKDLFETDENYVIPVQKFRETDELKKAFQWLFDRETEQKEILKKVIPEYKAKAQNASKLLETLVNCIPVISK